MAEYLFLVPKDGEWQQASVNGKPLKTTDQFAYPGMPKILATDHVDYKSWEEHVNETIRDFRD